MSEYAPNKHGEHLWADLSAGFWDAGKPGDGWIDLTELEARAEAVRRDGEKARNLWIDASNKLAAVREYAQRKRENGMPVSKAVADELDAILDGEGESESLADTVAEIHEEGKPLSDPSPDLGCLILHWKNTILLRTTRRY